MVESQYEAGPDLMAWLSRQIVQHVAISTASRVIPRVAFRAGPSASYIEDEHLWDVPDISNFDENSLIECILIWLNESNNSSADIYIDGVKQ